MGSFYRCMHDEAAPFYVEMIDQTTRGHQVELQSRASVYLFSLLLCCERWVLQCVPLTH